MKAEDLRIGNIVLINNAEHHPNPTNSQEPLKVFGVSATAYGYSVALNTLDVSKQDVSPLYSQLVKFISPIPLTEEWLERFGLEKITYSFRGWRARDINKTFEVIGDELRMNSPLLSGPLTIHKGLRYVHQLQNLYHALTGEELNA